MSKAKRLLAAFLTVVMMMGMIPTQMFAEQAEPLADTSVTQETENAPADTETPDVTDPAATEDKQDAVLPQTMEAEPVMPMANTNTYKQVAKPVAGKQYVIVVNQNGTHHVLAHNGSSFLHNVTGTVNGDILTIDGTPETQFLWTGVAGNGNDSASVYFALNGNQTKQLSADASWGITLTLGTSNRFFASGNHLKMNQSFSSVYLVYSGEWYGSFLSGDASPITYYEKVDGTTPPTPVDEFKLNVSWVVDGTQVSTVGSKTVKNGSEIKLMDLQKPAAVKGKELVSVTINGKTADEHKLYKITQDTTIVYTYKTPGKPDPKPPVPGDNFPEYPHQGSVLINKHATAEHFNANGVAKVELSATGVPQHKGVDVVIVFDVSTSMKEPVYKRINGELVKTSDKKLDGAKTAAVNFIDKLMADHADGSKSDNRVALVTFAGWDKEDNGNKIAVRLTNDGSAVKDKINQFKESSLRAGTDYNYAFSAAEEVLTEKADPNREQYVIFMTDGAPSNYNTKKWNQEGSSSLVKEAITKSLTNANTVKKHATVYSIGFGMAWKGNDNGKYNGFYDHQANTVLNGIATDSNHYIDATDSAKLDAAFQSIAENIQEAGKNAVVTDKIGPMFSLQTGMTVGTANQGQGVVNLTTPPSIEVLTYTLYTHGDIGKQMDGKEITLQAVGTRRPIDPTVVETVTFSEDGKQAFSSLDTATPKKNIMDANGDINATNFTYTAADKTFKWKVGTINETEKVIRYDVYLIGSMEGKRAEDLYDTNEFAHIDYTNYLGNQVQQTYTKPKLPWGSALVTYEYYLVDKETGKPVNTAGDFIPFEKRVIVDGPHSQKIAWNSDLTVAAGDVKAIEHLPEGYTLHDPNAVYHVNAVSSGDGSWSINGKDKVKADGSTRTVGNFDAGCVNTHVAFGLVNTLTLIPDVVVLDYGKPVTIDVLANDNVLKGTNTLFGFNKVGAVGLPKLQGGSVKTPVAGTVDTYTGTYGNAIMQDGKVVYTLNKFFDGIEKFLYATKDSTVDKNGTTVVNYRYQQVTVMPATTVYYEDNFASSGTGNTDATSGIIYSGAWETVNSNNSGNAQQDDGTKYDHPYGTDSGYANNNELSAGSAHKVVGNAQDPATATFTFKGNGFDLISRTDSTSTKIVVDVYQGNEAVGTPIYSKLTNCQFKDGVLNQIPVQQWRAENPTPDTYTVKIYVYANSKVSPSANFYLDAVRIYNPVQGNAEAEQQYQKDGEAWPQVIELRSQLLNAWKGGTATVGAVYVDTQNRVTNVATYETIGPNNEIYLKPGQAIAFKVEQTSAKSIIKSIQIGAKSPTGSAVLTVGEKTSPFTKELNTATDMYYDITSYIGADGMLYITNNGASNSILSLTNLKITYTSDPGTSAVSLYVDDSVVDNARVMTAAYMTAEPVPSPDPEPTPDPEPQPEPDPQPGKPSIWDQIEDFFNGLFRPRH